MLRCAPQSCQAKHVSPKHLRSGAWNAHCIIILDILVSKGAHERGTLLFPVWWVSFLISRGWKGLYKLQGHANSAMMLWTCFFWSKKDSINLYEGMDPRWGISCYSIFPECGEGFSCIIEWTQTPLWST